MSTPEPRTTATATPCAEHDSEEFRLWSMRPRETHVMDASFSRESAMWHADKYPHLIPVSRIPGGEWEDARPAPSGPGEYHVEWAIEVHANGPEDAARQALAKHRDPGSIACVYDVSLHDGTSRVIEVDLNTPEEVNGPLRDRPLPVDVAQLDDSALYALVAAAEEELERRNDAALPGAVRAAVLEHLEQAGTPVPGELASVTFGTTEYDNGQFWNESSAMANFADRTSMELDLSDDGELPGMLADHSEWSELSGGELLTVKFDPPGLTVS